MDSNSIQEHTSASTTTQNSETQAARRELCLLDFQDSRFGSQQDFNTMTIKKRARVLPEVVE